MRGRPAKNSSNKRHVLPIRDLAKKHYQFNTFINHIHIALEEREERKEYLLEYHQDETTLGRVWKF